MIGRKDGKWTYLGELDTIKLDGKRPGLQGPIDDAFTTPFLCVRGTGKAWNPAVQAWAEANLKRFAYEWSRYFRGDLPVKDDTAVTDEDIQRFNLILFGDPGSNALIARVLPKLPASLDRIRAAAWNRPVRRRRPCSRADSAEPAGNGPLRRAQQRPHLPREGTRIAQLSALPAPRRLGGPESRQAPGEARPIRWTKK